MFKLLYLILNKDEISKYLLNKIARLCTFYILDKNKRKQKRKSLYHKLGTQLYGHQVIHTAKSIGESFWCGGFSQVTPNTILKDHVCFNGMRIRGGGTCTIGRYFHSGIGCLILTQNHNYDTDDAIPYGKTYTYKDTVIEDFVWLGARVTLLPGTKIGEGAIIQGGAVVHGEIPPYAIAGGNLAKVFKYRNKEHFEKLKAEGKFFQ